LEEGDISGWGTELGSKIAVSSRKECADRCDALPKCLSFEHSDTENFCNLNKKAMPTKGKYGDYAFCRKFKNGKCFKCLAFIIAAVQRNYYCKPPYRLSIDINTLWLFTASCLKV
jgi:hypothetical protein